MIRLTALPRATKQSVENKQTVEWVEYDAVRVADGLATHGGGIVIVSNKTQPERCPISSHIRRYLPPLSHTGNRSPFLPQKSSVGWEDAVKMGTASLNVGNIPRKLRRSPGHLKPPSSTVYERAWRILNLGVSRNTVVTIRLQQKWDRLA